MSQSPASAGSKRKADAISKDQEIEVDLTAPEPPSKKSQRKAKKAQIAQGPKNADVEVNQLSKTSESSNGQLDRSSKKGTAEYGIWIGNLAFFTTKEGLTKFFTKPGTEITSQDITRINLPKGTAKHGPKPQNKGFAYVDFTTKTAQDAAIALSEVLLDGRKVLIKGAKNFEGRPEKAEKETEPLNPPSKRIFVGNLGFDVTVQDVQDHFSRCGAIENVHMATFQDSGKCKGYGWVTFDSLEAAQAAVRGWVDLPADGYEDEEGQDGDGDDASKQQKGGRGKRIQVNRIHGRKLRMEFAEDASTRYKKRFGKEGRDKEDAAVDERAVGITEDNTVPQHTSDAHFKHQEKREKQGQTMDRKQEPFRYGRTTVQRLTGAAVQGQGKKTTF